MIPKLKNITYICPPLSCFMNEPLTNLLISPLFTFPHTPPLGFRCGSFLIPRLLLLLILYLIPLSLTVSPHSLCVYPPPPPFPHRCLLQLVVGVLAFIIGVLTLFLPETLGQPLTSTLEEAEALGSKPAKDAAKTGSPAAEEGLELKQHHTKA